MTTFPSVNKNKGSAPSSFSQLSTSRIVIDCCDIEIAVPRLMSQLNATYPSYRGMNSLKVIVDVAPNAVMTYVSKLYPGSISVIITFSHRLLRVNCSVLRAED